MLKSDFTVGIEEEYFLVDAESFATAGVTADAMFKDADAATKGAVKREFLQSQVEVITRPHASIAAARDELIDLRLELARIAGERGIAIMAAGTHPTALWNEETLSPGWRYEAVMDSLQMIGRRNMLCGTHVHVELPDPDRRYDVMTRMLPYLPLLLALSTSSPFWQRHRTGLKGYRLAAYDELPRTGMPELLRTKAEFDDYVTQLSAAGAIPDSSHLWWAIRPSLRYPTLELRALDSCTRLQDTIALAALYRTMARHLYFNPNHLAGIGAIERAIAIENQWLAKRHGTAACFVSSTGRKTVTESLDEVIELMAADAEALGCLDEVLDCRRIVDRGSSADRQLAIYDAHSEADGDAAFTAVAAWLVATTTGSALSSHDRDAVRTVSPSAADIGVAAD